MTNFFRNFLSLFYWRFFLVHLQLHNTVHCTAHYRRWFRILAHYEHQKSKEMEPNWQWVQRCLAQKTKLIFNRFLPQRLRWFSMDFYAESKLIFNRFLREIVNGFLPQKSARFIAQKVNWIQFVLLPRKSKEFSSFSWQENDLNWARFIAQKINRIELVLLPRKWPELSSFYCPENQ